MAEGEGEAEETEVAQKPFWERVWDFLTPPTTLPAKFAGQIVWSKEMATVYLLTPGTTVYKEHQRFIFWIPQDGEDNSKVEIPIREIERILAFGNVQFTAPVMHACLDKEIVVLLLSGSGEYRGHLWSLESVSLPNQVRQMERQKDAEFQLQVSGAIVRGKLMNSKQLLLRNNRKRQVGDVELAIAGITKDILAADAVRNLDSLRGYEGVAASRYFPAFGKLIVNSAFSFSLRNRQPPTDPVNSMLSFGYTLLFNNVLSLIIAEGLSPYFGNFHYAEDGRTKTFLAFDLMEEFRSPVVDSFVLKMINNFKVKPTDFDKVASTGGVYLSRKSRKGFLNQFEDRMNEMVSHPDVQSPVCYRQAIQLQIRRYKRCLLHGVDYEPFIRPA
ncbi:MAG: CRISPR-associated endonuclease Cas1 [Cyanobacteriota bacterium]|nr:CRISPR-associated endonuclease Cas1 [Cyanobacteriota bacterium]